MTEYSMEEIETTVRDLWQRRDRLSEKEHTLFYRLVSGYLSRIYLPHYYALRRCHPLSNLEELKQQFIDDFYCDVIYLRALRGREGLPLHHLGALTLFYKNWLIDRIRRCMTRLRYEDPGGVDDNAVAGITSADPLNGQQAAGEMAGAFQAVKDFIEDSEAEFTQSAGGHEQDLPPEDQQPGGKVAESLLWDQDPPATEMDWGHDWRRVERSAAAEAPDPGRIRQAAADFLDWADHRHAQAREAPWILIFLGCHHCPADAEDSVPMSALRERFAIPNYHERARRLGITSARGGFPSLEHFAKTLLGQWIRDLGFRIHLSELSAIGEALKILCEEALVRVKTRNLC